MSSETGQVTFEEHQAKTEALTRELEMVQELKHREVHTYIIQKLVVY